MTTIIAKFIGKKILGETLENKFGKEVCSLIANPKRVYCDAYKNQDPYFEQVPVARLDGTPSGKVKKRRKALPPGISDNDGKVLTKVKRRAYRLDMCLANCCGVRLGWGSVIGFMPV
jgi:hypothetical protein